MQRLKPKELAEKLYRGSSGVNPADFWVHIKSGSQYIVITTTLRESDLEPMVVYVPTEIQALGYSVSFVRPVAEFKEKFRRGRQ